MTLFSDDDIPADWAAKGCAVADILTSLWAGGWTAGYLNQSIEVSDLRLRLRDVRGVEQISPLFLRVGDADLPPPASRRPVDEDLVTRR